MRGILTEDMTYGLSPGFAKVCRGFKTGLIEYDEEDNYIHLLLKYPPETVLSGLAIARKVFSTGRSERHPPRDRSVSGGMLLARELLRSKLRQGTIKESLGLY